MAETSARLLRLLGLLQSPRSWTGGQLAERLEVDIRTVRRDVERLRGLGYPVQTRPGAAGYRLGIGAQVPPLLLDDEEAVAVAIGLRTAAGGTISGIGEASLRALTKLEGVLPSRLRHRVQTLQSVTVPVPSGARPIDGAVLTAIAAACRAREQLRFDYRSHDGTETIRRVEPYRLVHAGRRWYLAGWDLDRAEWRTFRVDRLRPRIPTGPRFRPRVEPDDLGRFVSTGVSTGAYRYQGRFTLHVPIETAADRIPPTVGVLEAVDERSCTLRAGSNSLDELVLYVGLFGFRFEVHEPPELVEHVRTLADRLGSAVPPG